MKDDMKVVYIAGAYIGANDYETDLNIKAAQNTMKLIIQHCPDWAVFCPHMNSAQFDRLTQDVPAAYWYKADLVILEKCDLLIFLPGWQWSHGTKEEIKFAREHSIEICDIYQFLTKYAKDLPNLIEE